jgi:putative aldouronate transport system permease protein
MMFASRSSTGEKVFAIINVLLLFLLVLATTYPLLYVLFASVSDPASVVAYRGILWRPLGFTLSAYRMVFTNPMIGIGYRNTLLYVILGTTVNLFLTILGAYGLSRKNLMWKNALMFFIVFTMFFSGGLVPSYLLVAKTLHLENTPWALILPGAISTWNLIILRTAFQAVPEALEEAARMDGANDLTILLRIMLPMSLPAIAVMILFYAVAHWNAWFSALIYLRTRELIPLQLVLREILILSQTDTMAAGAIGGDREPIGETIKFATIIVATVPILFVYPFLQRYFVKGVMIGALKE